MPADGQTSAHATGFEKLADHGLSLEAPRAIPTPSFSELDDWRLADDVRHLTSRAKPAIPAAGRAPAMTLPMPEHLAASSAPVASAAASAPARQNSTDVGRAARSSLFAWLFLSFGLMAFLCGIVLLVWSVLAARGELWDLGMPITVVGQAALVLGLILQLERIWQGNRYTVDKLDHVDKQLDELRQTASMMGMSHSSASQAFYSHLTQGASPHILLADLKGQLDLLAVKMSDRR
jgi:hypothetical protein